MSHPIGRTVRLVGGADRNHFTGAVVAFAVLGNACAVLAAMVFLVLAEALVPNGSLPGPLYVARGMRGWFRRTRRYSRIGRIISRHGLAPYLRGRRRAELATPEGRSRLARSLRLALDEGGAPFIKLGQVLSTRRDLLPAEFVDEFARLQDNASQVPWPEIEAVLRAELGTEVDAVFAEFDRRPLAAASIAQVHAARLRSGEQVVVKVRRPGMMPVVHRDLDIARRLAGTLRRSTGWGRSIDTAALADGFAAALLEEPGLRVEARNMTAVAVAAAARGEDVVVPRTVEALCTREVLVMHRLAGRPLLRAGAELDRSAARTLARTLFACLLRQVMLDGVFHADPHPGNIFLLDDGKLALLDFGSVGRIDAALRASMQRLLLALDSGVPADVTDALLDVVVRPDELDEPTLRRALGRFLARYATAGPAPDVQMFTDLFRIVSAHGLSVPPEIAAVFRAPRHGRGKPRRARPGVRHRGRGPRVREPNVRRGDDARRAAPYRGRRAGRDAADAAPAAPPPGPGCRWAGSGPARRQRPAAGRRAGPADDHRAAASDLADRARRDRRHHGGARARLARRSAVDCGSEPVCLPGIHPAGHRLGPGIAVLVLIFRPDQR